MNVQEHSRLTEALQNVGWTDTEITNFILWVETGEERVLVPVGGDVLPVARACLVIVNEIPRLRDAGDEACQKRYRFFGGCIIWALLSLPTYTEFVHTAQAIRGFMLILQNAFSGLLIAFVAVLLCAVLAVLGRSIGSTIQADYADMGALKTVGFTSGITATRTAPVSGAPMRNRMA